MAIYYIKSLKNNEIISKTKVFSLESAWSQYGRIINESPHLSHIIEDQKGTRINEHCFTPIRKQTIDEQRVVQSRRLEIEENENQKRWQKDAQFNREFERLFTDFDETGCSVEVRVNGKNKGTILAEDCWEAITLEIREEEQDYSQIERMVREKADRVTAQRKNWVIEREIIDNIARKYVNIDPSEIWSFLRDMRYHRNEAVLPSKPKDLTALEINTLRGVKGFKKIRPDGTQTRAANVLIRSGLISAPQEGDKIWRLTPKGQTYLEEVDR